MIEATHHSCIDSTLPAQTLQPMEMASMAVRQELLLGARDTLSLKLL